MSDTPAAAPNVNPVNQIANLLSTVDSEGVPLKKEKPDSQKPLEGDDEGIDTLAGAEGDKPVEDPTDTPIDGLDDGGDDDDPALAGDEGVNDGSGDEGDIDTLNNLAEELDVPVSDLYELNVKMSEGEPQTLGALKDFYEANRDVEGLRDNITQEREALVKQAETLKEIPQITNEFLQARAQVISISDQYNRIDWDTLRQQQPGQYAALKQDFETAFSQAKQAETLIADKVSANDDQQAQFQQERLFQAIPELKDDGFREKAATSVATLAGKYGFSVEEVANITDSRLMHLLIDVSNSQQAVSTARSKQLEKEAPVSKKPSGRKHTPGNAGRKATLKKLTDKAKATGDRRDQVSAVSALIS